MQIVWQINIVSLLAVILNVVILTAFVVRLSERAGAAERKADAAQREAREAADAARKGTREASDKIVILTGAFSSFRETVAQTYISRETMREVEERLATAIERLGDRLDRLFEKHRQA